ncbi:MAG: MauE/DoxX family redox-associated membrane protein [Solirubrobacterales bacterium]
MLGACVLLLCGVLATAGAAKLLRPDAARAAVRDLVPTAPAAGVIAVVALVELAVAGVLASGVATRPAAAACVVLFALFDAFLALRRRAAPGAGGCGCFGEAEPSGPARATGVRNRALAVSAAVVALLADQATLGPGPAELAAQATVALGIAVVFVLATTLAALAARPGHRKLT